MKIGLLVLALAGAAAGCTTVETPTKLASGATSGMWTTSPPAEMQSCIDSVKSRFPNASTQFTVTGNDPAKVVYATTVSVFNNGHDHDPVEEAVVAQCIVGPERSGSVKAVTTGD